MLCVAAREQREAHGRGLRRETGTARQAAPALQQPLGRARSRRPLPARGWSLSRVVPSFTEFYWVLTHFTEFYWVLLGFNGF